MKNIIGAYLNGNYSVIMLEDGTKIRSNMIEPTNKQSPEDAFNPQFPESIDVCITKRCDVGCPICYASCTPNGKQVDIMKPNWVYNMHPYTELAIGGGNIFEHPQLKDFLNVMDEQNVICNITLNQKHYIEHIDDVMKLTARNLVHGVGVSVTTVNDKLIDYLRAVPNTVIHAVAGIITIEELVKLSYEHLKLLILGYKTTGRGMMYGFDHLEDISDRIRGLENIIMPLIDGFDTVSFDNLALKQLHMRDKLTDAQWNEFYMGDDGIDGRYTSATMYIDMPFNEFSFNSIDSRHFEIGNRTVDEMFWILKANSSSN